jgi:hypothetical protein
MRCVAPSNYTTENAHVLNGLSAHAHNPAHDQRRTHSNDGGGNYLHLHQRIYWWRLEVDSVDPQVTGRRFGGSFTIAEWCKHRRVSISMYYKLRAQGKAPATLPVGRHQTITAEADAAWARERQAEANAGIPISRFGHDQQLG